MQMSCTISTGVLMTDTSVSLGLLHVHHNKVCFSSGNLEVDLPDMDEKVAGMEQNHI
jgi:hypothetical protein